MAGNDNAMSSNIVQRLVTPGSLTEPKLLGDLVREMWWVQARLVVRGWSLTGWCHWSGLSGIWLARNLACQASGLS